MKIYFCSILLLCLPLFIAAQTVPLSENDKTQIIEAIFKGYGFNNQNITINKSKISVNLSAKHILPKMISGIEGVNVFFISEKDIDAMVATGGNYYYLSEFEVEEDSFVKVTFGRIGIGKGTGTGSGIYWKYYCRKVSGKWEIKREVGEPFHLLY
ncbi:hypothetical protein BH20ACI1_BH20ACI1_07740 [soil metagenome]